MDAAALKLIAMVTMLIDHTGDIFFPGAAWMRAVGRIAMPIYAFFIAEGCVYTRSRPKYLLRLLLFAVLSELPFDLAFFGRVTFEHQNVLWTFALAVAAIMLYERVRGNGETPGSAVRTAAALLCVQLLALSAILLQLDYSAFGVIAVFLFYLLRGRKQWVRTLGGVGFLAITRTAGMYAWTGLAALPLLSYNGKRGAKLKWLYYLFYPCHLLLLWAIARVLK